MEETAVARYKRKHGLSYWQVAALFQISPGYARKLGAGMIRRVSPDTGERIERLSGGEIKAEDLVFPERPRKPTRKAPS
jgi:hypothetical protein